MVALTLATIGYFVGDWLLGFAGAARQSIGEIDSARTQREYTQYAVLAYGVYGITMLLTASIAFCWGAESVSILDRNRSC